ncbi:MAG: hypothetical protein J2P17_07695 [Mycobacterium sp.]|nr:hypothetical protein [Mycobacterium sp.]
MSGANIQIAATAGSIIGVGLVLTPTAGSFTCARVLVFGDLLRRVFKGIPSAQMLAAAITNNDFTAKLVWRPEPYGATSGGDVLHRG